MTTDDDDRDGPAPPHPLWTFQLIGPLMRSLLDGTATRPVPSIGRLPDGSGLFYPGRVNSLFGATGAAKSWLGYVTAADELAAGRTVWIVDFEDDALGCASRFVDLGLDPVIVDAWCRYVHPDVALDLDTVAYLRDAMTIDQPSLIVVDSVGEWMGVDGVDTNRDEQVARWYRAGPTFLTLTGAAVVIIDHLPHLSNGRLSPIGSVRKINAVTGAAYVVEVVAEFGLGRIGRSRLITAKDRHGARVRGSAATDFVLDATTSPGRAYFEPPTATEGERPSVTRVRAALDTAPGGGLDTRAIGDLLARDGVGPPLKRRTIQDALTRLADLGEADSIDHEGRTHWMRTTFRALDLG